MKNNEILVSVLCITYNHESYIRETLEGILMQKTDFPYEVLIHEDASTDNTAAIIREYEKKYPDLFKVIYESENQYNKGIEYCHDLLAPKARGKYIALCEGDDSWIDDRKLQLQVDYMEKHPECSLITHKAFLQYPSSWDKKRDSRVMGYPEEGTIPYEELFKSWSVATSSFLFPKDIYMKMPKFFRTAPTGDEPLKFYLAGEGAVYYIDRVMSVYNRMSIGSWSSRFEKDSYKKQVDYCKGYVEFFSRLDEYRNFENHDFFCRCIRERIKRILVHILFTAGDEAEAQDMVDALADACLPEYRDYILSKKSGFMILDKEKLGKLIIERSGGRDIYVYGAGGLAKQCIVQIRDYGIPIKKITINEQI